MGLQISATIVVYKNFILSLEVAVSSFLNTEMNVKLYIVDNSPTDYLKEQFDDPRVEYFFMNSNNGFGAGHNYIMRCPEKIGKYHLVLNPDISFNRGVNRRFT